jgi:outer membrane protein assembly factor BamB
MEDYMQQQPTATNTAKERFSLYILVAMLIIGLLSGGYFWLMHTSNSQSHLTSMPPPLPSTLGPQNVYMARNNHVVKLDGRTGAIIWQQTLTPPGVNSPQTCMQIVNGVMYAVLDYDSYAFRTSDGKQLWHVSIPSTHSKNLSCSVADNRVYVLHRDGTYSALATRDGSELWRSAVVLTDSMIFQVQHGAIYSEPNVGMSPRLTATDATTGKERWHVDLQAGNIMSPTLVANGIVYHTTGNTLYALDEATGRIIWQQHTDNPAIYFSNLSIADSVLYTGTGTVDSAMLVECKQQPLSNCPASSYHVYAFDASRGSLLWKSAPGLDLYSISNSTPDQLYHPGLPPLNGTVFAGHYDSSGSTLYALDGKNGKVRWQANPKCPDESCSWLLATLDGKTITLIDLPYQSGSTHLLTFDLSNGRQLAQQTLAIQNQGRPVVFAGMDASRIYVLAKGDANTLDVIHSLNLTNNKDLWRYQVDNYASGSIELPIVAP